MQYTLLELTQDVLSSMDSDEVNSINDTVESQQVATIIKTVYDDIVSRGELVEFNTLFNLTASGDNAKPVLMTKPSNISRISWLRYDNALPSDTSSVWEDLKYLTPEAFIQMTQSITGQSNTDSMVHVSAGFAITTYFFKDRGPTYFTSFDDNTVLFDAFNLDVENTLQSSKTLGYGQKKTDFSLADNFTPNLQPHQFALLLNEAKSLAWVELKQAPHQKAEKMARSNWNQLHRRNITDGKNLFDGSHPFNQLPNFGRH